MRFKVFRPRTSEAIPPIRTMARFRPRRPFRQSASVKRRLMSITPQLDMVLVLVFHFVVFLMAYVNYHTRDDLGPVRLWFGSGIVSGQAAAMVLNVDAALILWPSCRNLISLLSRTPFGSFLYPEIGYRLQNQIFYMILLFTVVHVCSNWTAFAFASPNQKGIHGGLAKLMFHTGPGATGFVMLVLLIAAAVVSTNRLNYRQSSFRAVTWTHVLIVALFVVWSFHGSFCVIGTDEDPSCSGNGIFWMFWIFGATAYLVEMLIQNNQAGNAFRITKLVQHSGNTVEVQFAKQLLDPRAGQFIYLSCPTMSTSQWHRYYLTSAPEEDHISVHIRQTSLFSTDLAKELGCRFQEDSRIGIESSATNDARENPDPEVHSISTLPRLCVIGPFGSASESVFKYEASLLVGAGEDALNFASVLKSAWYRIHYPQHQTMFRKMFFVWICKDFAEYQWFRSLCMAVEEQDINRRIQVHTYLTGRTLFHDSTTFMSDETDLGFLNTTIHGRPNWITLLSNIKNAYPCKELAVFSAGPPKMLAQLKKACKLESTERNKLVWRTDLF